MSSSNGTSGSHGSTRDEDIVKAYMAGMKVTEMEERFEIGRSTIYHVLRRSGTLPARTRRRMEAAGKDLALAGLYELIAHQDNAIQERDERIAELERQLRTAQRKASRAATSKPGRAG